MNEKQLKYFQKEIDRLEKKIYDSISPLLYKLDVLEEKLNILKRKIK